MDGLDKQSFSKSTFKLQKKSFKDIIDKQLDIDIL